MRIAIIGGGAAGLMAAATLLEEGVHAEIHLFEKNKILGQKVIISGGGRCNVTTGIHDKQILRKKYTRGADFLVPAISAFSPKQVMSWFEGHGVPLKTEDDLRVFPKSDDGHDVVGAFERLFREGKLQMRLGEAVKAITPVNKGFSLETTAGAESFDIVVVTTGGNAYRHTGSTGDGYAFAKACGHTITPLGPSLNSFEIIESWPKTLSGLSLTKARLEAIASDGQKKSATGPLLFTHFGVSGPVVFALSSHLAFTPVSARTPILVSLIPSADQTFESWDTWMKKTFHGGGSLLLRSALAEHLPRRLVEQLLILAKIDPDQTGASITKEKRRQLLHLLSGSLKLAFAARRPGDEFVTAGGVELAEVDPKTMQSLKTPGLFFAGEVLNIDGVTGGFNLQASWATGRLAGKSISAMLH